MSKGHRLPSSEAIPHAERIAFCLEEQFGRVIVCGSLRRLRPDVGDLDLVVCGLTSDHPRVFPVLSALYPAVVPDVMNSPERPRVAHEVSDGSMVHPLSVDVWVVPEESLGAAVLYSTGDGLFNVIMRRWAKFLGMRIDVYGVHRDGKVVASRTEEDCFEALQLPFVPPQHRIPEVLSELVGIMNHDRFVGTFGADRLPP